MNHLYLTYLFIFLFTSSTLQGQDFNVFALGAVDESSRSVNTTSKFLEINVKDGATKIVSDLSSFYQIAKGTTTLDPIRNELFFWAKKSIESDFHLYSIDATSGQSVVQPIPFPNHPIDVQFDMRQNILYGLQINQNKKGVSLVKIDGKLSIPVLELPMISAVSLGNTAFDSHRSFYIFLGTDENYIDRLYVIDILNKKILSQKPLKKFYFYEFQYDLKDSKLYALCRKKTNIEQFFFVEIDVLDTRPIIIAPMINLINIQSGTSSFEQNDGIFVFIGSNNEGERFIYSVDVYSGDLISKSRLNVEVYALECKNSAFIISQFGELDSRPEQSVAVNLSKPLVNQVASGLASFPSTVVSDLLTIDLDLPEGSPFSVAVYDLTDRKILEKKLFKSFLSEDNALDLVTLEAGIYIVKIMTKNQVNAAKIIKR